MHCHLVLDEYDDMRMSYPDDRLTVIMATAGGRLDLLAWSLFSLLLRTDHSLDKVFVAINGPKNDSLLDEKQRFLLAVADIDKRLSVARLWGHLGHAHCLDMLTPWCFTGRYAIMHDDVIIRDRNWLGAAATKLHDSFVVAVAYPHITPTGNAQLYMCGMNACSMGGEHTGKRSLITPHPCSALVICKTIEMHRRGGRWRGHHVWLDKPKKIGELVYVDKVVDYWSKRKLLDIPAADLESLKFDAVSHDIGTWLLYNSCEAGLRWETMDVDMAFHVERATWDDRRITDRTIQNNSGVVTDIVDEIKRSGFARVYQQHVERK